MITKWLVCRCLTCRVHPKTPIMSIATHRYSEKTSHHGFRTRNFEFCSVPRFLNSPSGIILAAAPHWWKKRVTVNAEAKIGFEHTQCSLWRTTSQRVLKLYDRKKPHGGMHGTVCVFIRQTLTTSFRYPWPWMNEWAVCSFAVGGFKVEKLVWQQCLTTLSNCRGRGLRGVYEIIFHCIYEVKKKLNSCKNTTSK